MDNERSIGQMMREYNDRVAGVVEDMVESQVKEILGQPAAVMSRAAALSPTEFFEQIGSMFKFPDDSADVVWAYIDPNRPRVRNYVAFKQGRVVAKWKETLTQARWDELHR